MVADGTRAVQMFLNETSEGKIHIEYPDNKEERARFSNFPLENRLIGVVKKKVLGPTNEVISRIANAVIPWAEENGWRRKDEMVGEMGVVTLVKAYPDGNE